MISGCHLKPGIYTETLKNKKLGLDKTLLGTRIVPFLIPLAMEPVLKLSQVWSGDESAVSQF